MKIETLKERIEKKEVQIGKKYNTIEKKKKLIDKKQNQIIKKESELTKLAKKYGEWFNDNISEKREIESEIGWLRSDIGWLEDDIKRLHREIEEAHETLKKYRAQLAGELEKEAQFIKEVPEQAKDMEQMLIEKWDASEKNRRDYYIEQYKELSYAEFIKKFKHTAYEFMHTTDEEIHEDNVKHARVFVLDLLNRTKEITGEITSWDDVRLTVGTNGYPVLNGYVVGKEGRAVVESIYAGGYNIQRLHVRVLVKAC